MGSRDLVTQNFGFYLGRLLEQKKVLVGDFERRNSDCEILFLKVCKEWAFVYFMCMQRHCVFLCVISNVRLEKDCILLRALA